MECYANRNKFGKGERRRREEGFKNKSMPYQTWSALTASSYNKIYKQNAPTTKAWNVDTVLKKERKQPY